ncbi:MAG: hypothetical protein UX12_C0028G0003 [Candidatus Collierbacteria bacterium GW2011_GWC1_45_47]|nr:MAG: hypothetical protein UX12_C0028G0003 [Candidatus Collierbacteria bacterium GW2011_GWC1_45_47]
MKTRYEYDITKIEGPDADIETSLKEYGIAWIEGPEDIIFYYGIEHDDTGYVRFDFCVIDRNLDIKNEYDWAEFDRVSASIGSDIFEGSLIQQIQDLVSYYGYEEIFGSSYWAGIPYEGVFDRCYIERGEL